MWIVIENKDKEEDDQEKEKEKEERSAWDNTKEGTSTCQILVCKRKKEEKTKLKI